jgi:hypothetical protein
LSLFLTLKEGMWRPAGDNLQTGVGFVINAVIELTIGIAVAIAANVLIGSNSDSAVCWA